MKKKETIALINDVVQYLNLKLISFRREYPEHHCIVQTAVQLRDRAIKASNELNPITPWENNSKERLSYGK